MGAAQVEGFDDLLVAAAAFAGEDEEKWARVLDGLAGPVRRRIFEQWSWQVHKGQREPEGDWRTWLLMAGRGFGKTRAGAEWVWARVREAPGARIALVGGTMEDVARVMVCGPSGILATAGAEDEVRWLSNRALLRFGNGAEGLLYSAGAPESLRGPEHHFAWCDELAKWPRGDETWDNLQMGMRLGERPRLVVTTTPRTSGLVRRVRALSGTVETRGRTRDNVHTAAEFRRWAAETYGGTRLGRQELDGELLEDFEGALFSRALIERSRQSVTLPREDLVRVVVGVDPPASAEGDECGIVVCGRMGSGRDEVAYVLEDASVGQLSPEGWARRVAAAVERWAADRVVAEGNQGGNMVEAVLRGAGVRLPVKRVHASVGKAARAEPVAALFECREAKLAGAFSELEDQMAGLLAGGGYEGPGRSPDRADAMVYAMTELMLVRRHEPRITTFGRGGFG